MIHQIDAIFDNGVLRPLVPLQLPDKTHVKLAVTISKETPPSAASRGDWEQFLQGLARDCGVSLPNVAVSSEGLYE